MSMAANEVELLPTHLTRRLTNGPLKQPTFIQSLKAFFLSSWLNVLLVFVPLGLVSDHVGWPGVAVFVLNFLAIIPLAKMLGYATEELSLRVGQAIGGLLNATFGNAVEMIISIIALVKGLVRVVQASLIGSILSNLLLVLGMCFLFGGLKYEQQTFNEVAAQTSASLLAMAVVSLLLPAAYSASIPDAEAAASGVLNLSHATAVILLMVYLMFLIFQLRTHKHLYVGTGEEEGAEEEEPTLSTWFAGGALVVVTVIVALHAEAMVGSIEAITKSIGISETFIGLIIIPIVGNAAEHVTAVTVAMKNKMELAIGVAVGSSTQIALFVTPVLVIVGWIINQPMTLFFQTFETAVLFLTVFVTNYLIQDGKSNWLEGGMLLATYIIVAVSFYYHPDVEATR
jgi:Ca2+:H+ antiporter